MDKDELLSVIQGHRDNSLGSDGSHLSNERATALDHYYGREYGNEQEGRSRVVSKDLSETVDWILPGLLRVFTQSGNISEFEPVGPEDEEAARQQSDYINYVFMTENNGVLNLYDAFKDALILKNYYFKIYVDESEKVREVEYSGLSEDEFAYLYAQLESEGEVDVVEQDEENGLLDVKLRVKSKEKKFIVDTVPPEEMRVSKRCRGNIQDSPFVEHRTIKTRSELIEMGMSKEFVDGLPSLEQDDNDDEVFSRDTVYEESDDELTTSFDRSMDEIEYAESYIRVDYDDDGVAELRKVITAADKLPPGSEWNEVVDTIPFATASPKRVPHRHIGESLDDELSELQEIKTVLIRQMLDNVYLTNNQQWIVNQRAHLPDFLQSLPGGVKRVLDDEPVDGVARSVETKPIVGDILPAIDYVDGMKENRSGVNETTTNIDPDVLKNANNKAYMEGMNKASQKVEMIARLFGEGVKDCLLLLHELMLKHQDKEKVVKLRGKYVPVNPAEWRSRSDMRLKVGLGTGSEEERRARLSAISQLQEAMKEQGLVGPVESFNLFTDMANAMGHDMPEKYIIDPTQEGIVQVPSQMFLQMQQKLQQGPENPLAEVEQVKGQFQIQKTQMEQEFKGQIEQLKMQIENEKERMKMQHDAEKEILKQQMSSAEGAAERASKEAIEAMKEEVKLMIEGFRADLGAPGISAGVQNES